MKNHIRVVVTRSAEPIDYDAWLARYCRAVVEADRDARTSQIRHENGAGTDASAE